MRTAQEIFDVSTLGILKQGRAATSGGSCVYRAPDGSKCAVGHLIPDHLYDRRMEGRALLDPADPIAVAAGIDSRHMELIHDIQTAHDSTLDQYGLGAWREWIVSVATKHKLSTKILDDFEATVESPYLLDLVS